MKKIKELLKKIVGFVGKVWKKGFWGKCAVIIGGIYLIGLIGSGVDADTSSVAKEESVVSDVEVQQVETPVVELTPEEKVAKILKDVYADDYISLEKSGANVVITVNLSDNLSNKLIRNGFKLEAFKALKKLKGSEYLNDVNIIDIVATTTFTNKYGEKSVGNAMIGSFKMEDINRVDFENVLWEDFYDNFDITGFVHPALQD